MTQLDVVGLAMHSEPLADENFLGLPFASLDMAEAVKVVEQASLGGAWRYVVTPNAAHLARLYKGDANLERIYRNAWLCLLDSRVISRIARRVGLRPPPVVAGSDLCEVLFREVISPSTPICVIGGDDSCINTIKSRFALTNVHHMNPPYGFWRSEEEVAKAAAFIVASRADYTF